MLVLTRKIGEEIVIGDGIRVSIVRLQGNRVQIGIDAPATVVVNRSEVWERDLVARQPAELAAAVP